MYQRAKLEPCPSNILGHACVNWQHKKDRKFFGRTYNLLTPREFAAQQIQLGLTKVFAGHLRLAAQHTGTKPARRGQDVSGLLGGHLTEQASGRAGME